jgi:hypothetical protein
MVTRCTWRPACWALPRDISPETTDLREGYIHLAD